MRRRILLRARLPLALATLATAACRSTQPGPSFTGASVLAPSTDAEAAHDELLRADLSRADSVGHLGFAAGLTSVFAGDVIYLRDGLPILRGKEAAHAVMSAESLGTNATVRWQPVRAEPSADRTSGFTYGYAIYGVSESAAPSLRVDRYIAFWRKEPAGWRIAGYAETYGSPPPPLTLPSIAANSALSDIPMSQRSGALDAMRSADVDFSRDATRYGTGEAFGRYAAADAQIFSGPGEFITGPAAITESFGPLAEKRSSLVWHPVDGEISSGGDLGFTVGNAVFNGEREDGAAIVRYSKYLTVWKRQRDGSWRYVVDGGSARPAK